MAAPVREAGGPTATQAGGREARGNTRAARTRLQRTTRRPRCANAAGARGTDACGLCHVWISRAGRSFSGRARAGEPTRGWCPTSIAFDVGFSLACARLSASNSRDRLCASASSIPAASYPRWPRAPRQGRGARRWLYRAGDRRCRCIRRRVPPLTSRGVTTKCLRPLSLPTATISSRCLPQPCGMSAAGADRGQCDPHHAGGNYARCNPDERLDAYRKTIAEMRLSES